MKSPIRDGAAPSSPGDPQAETTISTASPAEAPTFRERVLERECADLRKRLDAVHNSLRYRLGSALIAPFSAPKSAWRTPIDVAYLVREAWRQHAWRIFFRNLEIGQPNDPLRGVDPEAIKDRANLARLRRTFKSPAREAKHRADEIVAETRDPIINRAGRRVAEFAALSTHGLSEAAIELTARRAPVHERRVFMLLHASLATTTNGYAARSQSIAKALSERGWDVRPWVRDLGPGREDFVVDGVTYRALPPVAPEDDTLEGYVRAYATAVGLAAAEDGPAVIHAASNYITGLAAGLAARALRLPYFYEVRGFWEVTRASVQPGFALSPAFAVQRQLEAEACGMADAVFALNESLKSEIHLRRADANRVVVVPNGVADEDPQQPLRGPSADELRARFGLREGPVIGFVGSLTPYEGLDTALQAFRLLRQRRDDVQMLIIGDGGYLGELQSLAARLGVSNAVIFAGRVAQDIAAAAYQVIDVAPFVRADTPVGRLVTPLKPLEAMRAGVPIVVSNLRPLLEITDDGRFADVCEPGDAAALSEAFGRVFDHAAQARTRAEDAKQWLLCNFSWSSVADTIIGTYESV